MRSRHGSVVVALGLAVAVATGAVHAAEPRTMTGIYVTGDSEYPDSGEIVAVFTPTGDRRWDVVFRFDFQESDYTFTGSATGELSDGLLEGRVRNADRSRTFTFTGIAVDGVFQGTHAELEHGGETPTGTMTLELQDPDTD